MFMILFSYSSTLYTHRSPPARRNPFATADVDDMVRQLFSHSPTARTVAIHCILYPQGIPFYVFHGICDVHIARCAVCSLDAGHRCFANFVNRVTYFILY